MYIYIYTCTYTHTDVCMYLCLYVLHMLYKCTYCALFMNVCVCANLYVHIHVHAQTRKGKDVGFLSLEAGSVHRGS